MVDVPAMAKTVQINTISPYHASVQRSGMGLGPRNLSHMDFSLDLNSVLDDTFVLGCSNLGLEDVKPRGPRIRVGRTCSRIGEVEVVVVPTPPPINRPELGRAVPAKRRTMRDMVIQKGEGTKKDVVLELWLHCKKRALLVLCWCVLVGTTDISYERAFTPDYNVILVIQNRNEGWCAAVVVVVV